VVKRKEGYWVIPSFSDEFQKKADGQSHLVIFNDRTSEVFVSRRIPKSGVTKLA
jgi:hypothetical protein